MFRFINTASSHSSFPINSASSNPSTISVSSNSSKSSRSVAGPESTHPIVTILFDADGTILNPDIQSTEGQTYKQLFQDVILSNKKLWEFKDEIYSKIRTEDQLHREASDVQGAEYSKIYESLLNEYQREAGEMKEVRQTILDKKYNIAILPKFAIGSQRQSRKNEGDPSFFHVMLDVTQYFNTDPYVTLELDTSLLADDFGNLEPGVSFSRCIHGYDINLMSKNELEPNVIECEIIISPENEPMLQYRVIGLDGNEKQGSIPMKTLRYSKTKNNEDLQNVLKTRRHVLLPNLLQAISEQEEYKGHVEIKSKDKINEIKHADCPFDDNKLLIVYKNTQRQASLHPKAPNHVLLIDDDKKNP